MKIFSAIFILFLFGATGILSQGYGLPIILNYPRNVTNAGPHNWDICQSDLGVLAIANDKGLLSFDGNNWKLLKQPNKTIVRSLAQDGEGKIFIGGQNEIGYFENDKDGKHNYHDLKQAIDAEQREFEDVWDVVFYNKHLYFRASDKLYILSQDSSIVIHTEEKITFLGRAGDIVIFQNSKGELYRLDGFEWSFIDGSDKYGDNPISEVIKLEDGSLLYIPLRGSWYQYKNGEFKSWDKNKGSILKWKLIISAFRSLNGNLLIGTRTNGLFVFNSEGDFLYNINDSNGLISNSIRSIYVDKAQNTWIGSDKGISQLLTNSNLSRLYPESMLNEAGYCCEIKDNIIYLGTSDGVYKAGWSPKKPKADRTSLVKLKETAGQVWNLMDINDRLLMFHHAGLFDITSGKKKKISPSYGFWLCEPADEKTILCGTYDGIEVYNLDVTMNFVEKIDSFKESSRFLVKERKGIYWVTHPYKGIYRISMQDSMSGYEIERFGAKNGLPSDLSNYVFKIRGEVIFSTEDGIYSFSNQSFKPHDTYNSIFKVKEPVLRLVEGYDNTIWFVTATTVGYHKIVEKGLDSTIETVYIPEIKDQLIGGFESIDPIDRNNVIIGIQNGFLHCDPSISIFTDFEYAVILTEVINTVKNKVLYSGTFDGPEIPLELVSDSIRTLDYTDNQIVFKYSATSFDFPEKVMYSSYLEGAEENWNDWKYIKTKEYTNLDAGTYTFHLRAKDLKGKLSKEASYRFIISPPWYKTLIALSLYALLACGVLYLWYFYFDTKISEHKEKSILSEGEVIRLEKEKLELEIEHKNRELLSASMHMAHKNEVLSEVLSIVQSFKGLVDEEKLKLAVKKVNRILRIEKHSDSVWTQFVSQFNEVHPTFFGKLKSAYPILSQKDLKLCAYLKMNLSTKELASMLNISTRGVEGARYRLRKKMNLSAEESLTNFLYQFSPSSNLND